MSLNTKKNKKEPEETIKSKVSIFRLVIFVLFQIIKFYKWIVIGLITFDIILALLPIITTYIGGAVLDSLLTILKNNANIYSSAFLVPLLLLIGSIWIAEVLSYIRAYLDSKWENNREVFHDNVIIKYSLTLEPQLLDRPYFAHLKSRIMYNIWKISAVFEISRYIIAGIPAILLSLTLLAVYDWKLIILIVLSTIPTFLIRQKFGERLWSIWNTDSEEKIKYDSYISNTATNNLEQFLELKVFGYGRFLIQKATQINKKFIGKILTNERKRMFTGILYSVVEYILIGAAIFLAFVDVKLNIFSIGKFFVVYGLIFNFRENIYDIVKHLTSLTSKKKLLDSYYTFMHIKPQLKSKNIKLQGSDIEITFKNVWFKYPNTDNWVLKGVNLTIHPKENIALVGKNGAGKTTLIKLLLRVYDPIKGDIFINGINLKDLDLKDYYQKIGLLSQSFNILNIPVKDNIIIGDVKTKYSFKRMKKAATLANIEKKIEKLPKKYNTFLNRGIEGGRNFSGGEWQRLAIARVFYKNPDLIILDEPTSAIDALAEESIFNNIYTHTKEKTVVIISHRFATVKKAEQIFVLNNGKIVEHGTHKQLFKNNGLYKQMYLAQNK